MTTTQVTVGKDVWERHGDQHWLCISGPKFGLTAFRYKGIFGPAICEMLDELSMFTLEKEKLMTPIQQKR